MCLKDVNSAIADLFECRFMPLGRTSMKSSDACQLLLVGYICAIENKVQKVCTTE